MKPLFYIGSAIVVAVILGLGAAWWAVACLGSDAVRLGSWKFYPRIGSTAANALERARIAHSGLLGLNRSEAIYFIADRDEAGETLRRECSYRVEGRDPDLPPQDQEKVQADAEGHDGHEGQAVPDPLTEGRCHTVVGQDPHHDCVPPPRRRRPWPPRVGGVTKCQGHEDHEVPVPLEVAGPESAGIHHHEHGHGERHQGMLRQERAGHRKERQKDQEEEGQVPCGGQKEEPDAPIQPRLRDGLGQGQDAEDEEHGVLGKSLCDAVRLEDIEDVKGGGDEESGHRHGHGPRRPEEGGNRQNGQHHHGTMGHLFGA